MNKNALIAVTGGTGFLGYHLIPELLRSGYGVRLLLRKPGNPHQGAEAVVVDFNNEQAIAKALEGADAVIHAAGLVSYDRNQQSKMYDTHVVLTRRMIDAARAAGIGRFVHVSSIVTLGARPVPVDEGADYNAAFLRLAYWDTKTEAEKIALSANAPGFEVVSVNPGSLLGKGEKNGQLLPFLKKLAASERPILPDGGSDFLDCADAARGTVAALIKGQPGSRYVLGAENLTYAQFHAKLRGAFGKSSRPRVVPRWLLGSVAKSLELFESLTGIDLPVNSPRLRRVNGVYMFHDISKARRELGYNPGPIEPALRLMLEE